MIGFRVPIFLLQKTDDPPESMSIRLPSFLTEQNRLHLFDRELFHRSRQREMQPLRKQGYLMHRTVFPLPFTMKLAPGTDRPFGDREGMIRDDQLGIEFERAPESGTFRTGSLRIIEREVTWRVLRQTDIACLTPVFVVVCSHLPTTVLQDSQCPLSDRESRREGIQQSFLIRTSLVQNQTIDDDIEWLLFRVRCDSQRIGNRNRFLSPTDTYISQALDYFQSLPLRFPIGLIAVCHDDDRRLVGQKKEFLHDFPDRDTFQRLVTYRTMWYSGLSEQNAEKIIYLSHGSDRRTRTARHAFLIDGDGWRQIVDGIHVRFLEPFHEMPRIRRKRLDIPSIRLREYRIESQ